MIKSPARANHAFVFWCAVNVSQTNGSYTKIGVQQQKEYILLAHLEIVPGKPVPIEMLSNAIISALKPNQSSLTLNVLILPVQSNAT